MSDKRNTRGGAGWKARKTGKQVIKHHTEDPDVDAGQGYYAEVTRLLGGNTIEAKLHTGVIIQAKIPGIMYKRRGNWMKPGMIILVSSDSSSYSNTIFYEVIRIVKDSNDDSSKAKSMISKSNDDVDIFGNDDKSDDDDLEKIVNPNIVIRKQDSSVEKIMLSMKRKEEQKNRTVTSSKGQGRQFSDPRTLSTDE